MSTHEMPRVTPSRISGSQSKYSEMAIITDLATVQVGLRQGGMPRNSSDAGLVVGNRWGWARSGLIWSDKL